MKKIFYLIFVGCLALTAASCQKTEELSIIPSETETGVKLSVTANIEESDDTKVQYEFDGGAKSKIKPSWAVGDKIFGWDSNNTKFSFEVTEIKDGVATFNIVGEYAPEDGTVLYAIYYPGKTAENIASGGYKVDLKDDQSGILNNGAPVIMCATGSVNNGAVHFRFISQTCIVGIYKMQIFNNGQAVANKEIKEVTLNNVVTSARFVKGKDAEGKDVLKLEPFSERGTVTANVNLTTDNGGYIDVGTDDKKTDDMAPYFAVIPGNSQISVSAKDSDSKNYENLSVVSESLLSTGKYYYLGKKLGGIVAKIGETGYTTLKEAFDAANDSESAVTVKLFANADNAGVNADDTLAIRNANNKKVTLDLNGKTVSAPIKCYTDFEVTDSGNNGKIIANKCTISVGDAKKTNNPTPSSATFTLNGGTIEATEGNYAIWAEGTSNVNPNVVVNKGNINATKGSAARFKYATATFGNDSEDGEINVTSDNGFWTSNSSTVTFNKGTYNSTDKIYHFGAGTSKAVFNGGVFISQNNSFSYYSSVKPLLTIIDGKFSWENGDFFDGDHYDSQKVSITGGFFSDEVSSSCLSSEYACVECTYESEYTHRVTNGNIIQVGATQYSSLDGAITAINDATADVTVTLLADLYPSAAIAINNTGGHTTTLDLNGHTIYYNDEGHPEGSDNYRTIRASTPLIVKDGDSNNSGGGIKATHGALRSTGGKLKIEGGVFEGDGCAGDESNGSGVVYSYGNGLEITGGTIKCICEEDAGRAINFTKECSITGGTIICEGKGYAVRGYYNCDCTIDGENVFIYSESAGAKSPLYIVTSSNHEQNFDFNNGYVSGSASASIKNDTKIKVTGGHFNKNVNVGSGYTCVTNNITGPDGKQYTHTVVESEKCASLATSTGTMLYHNFSDAVSAANVSPTECTLRLLKDVSMGVTDENKPVTIEFNNPNLVTLDLNGRSLTTYIDVKGKLKIDDSSAEKNGQLKRTKITNDKGNTVDPGGRNISIIGGAEVELAAGTIVGPISSSTNPERVAVYLKGGDNNQKAIFRMTGGKITNKSEMGAVWVQNGIVDIYDGDIIAEGEFGRCFLTRVGADVTIYGGTFSSENCIWRHNHSNTDPSGKMDIRGGYFKIGNSDYSGGLFWISNSASSLSISGGYFGYSKDDTYGIIRFAENKSISSINITGGSFNKDARDKLPAADDYSWYELFGSDSSSLPGYDLKYIVRKTKL